MALKLAFVVMAPDGDPKRHMASIKTAKLELTVAVIQLMNFDQGVEVCKNLVQNEGVQSIILCPGFHNEAVARVVKAVGSKVAVSVARGDMPSGMITGELLAKEGWL